MKEEIQKRTVSCVNPENFLMLKGGPVVSAAPAPREVPRRVQGALRVATSPLPPRSRPTARLAQVVSTPIK